MTSMQVRKRGVMTLPVELRQKYGIKEGDTFRVVDLDGVFVLTPMVPMVPELARALEALREAAGLDVQEMLADLQAQRERFTQETYPTDDDAR